MFLALVTLAPALRGGEPADPLPGPETNAAIVSLLPASQQGQLQVEARGQGDQQVRIAVRNTTNRRLNVVFPPGLVAAAGVGQGFQSMGLGAPTRNATSFGASPGGSTGEGFQSLPATAPAKSPALALGAGQTLDLTVPAVCLNFGLPTPTPNEVFQLMDVDEYTPDVRARKALRSLFTLGTSQKVAQAVAWNVFNNMSFPAMTARASRILNPQELALAAKFVQTLDGASAADLVEPEQIRQGRVFVHVRGADALESTAARLSKELESQSLLGLPIRVVNELPAGADVGPSALYLEIALTAGKDGRIEGRVTTRCRSAPKAGCRWDR